jgi:general secretion pathway protein C
MFTIPVRPLDYRFLLRKPWRRGVPAAINLLLVLWLAYQVTRLVQVFSAVPQEQVVMDSGPVSVPSQMSGELSVSLAELMAMHLFGIAVEGRQPPEPDPVKAPDTHLTVMLHGTYVSDDPRFEHAIIANALGDDECYAIGDEIQAGTEVYAIFVDRVILSRGQRYETLWLLDHDPDVAASRVARLNLGRDSGGVARPTIKKLPPSLNELVMPRPVHKDGKFIGFRLEPRRNPELLDKMGLQRGDVITWLNEVYLDNPLKGMRAVRGISSGDYVNMTVQRDGRDISLSFYMP